ncbi:MAG TPA: CRISPR-associated endonuclease Cas1 [Verrucomicrobiota bacterium]|nr:CRISPR-associated endonuclease Cas1 [Verrucomicrobiota bacterium]
MNPETEPTLSRVPEIVVPPSSRFDTSQIPEARPDPVPLLPPGPIVSPPLPSNPLPGPVEPLPARMLNEFIYCPRLFYYEHVEGVFVENADTKRGAALHAKVDSGTGALPAAAPSPIENPQSKIENDVIHCRSVTLGSERLGVIAKLDLIEAQRELLPGEQADLFATTEVTPVDYKAGSPREGDESAELWPTDRMQLGLQMLILRDNGYICREGVIYYRGTKQRVRLRLTLELEDWVEKQIVAARACAVGPIPPPLEGSPKCVRCSLAPVCLPDETRLLAHAQVERAELRVENVPDNAPRSEGEGGRSSGEGSVRRLMAPRDESRALYLNTPGLRVGRKDETLQVKEKDELKGEVRLADLHHVALFGNIQLSTQALQILCDQEIPITYFSGGGWFYGITRGHGLKNIFLRVEQFRLASDAIFARRVSRGFVAGKIRNQRTMLMRNHTEPPAPAIARLRQAAQDALAAESLESLLGIEGAAAAVYFEHFAGMLKHDAPAPDEPSSQPSTKNSQLTFDFTHRNRRPPTDPVNALLSLAYSLLSKDCLIATLAVGFDPYLGFYHQPRFGRPALALDLMEEFRPLVADSAVLTAINTGVITPDDFVQAGKATNLSPTGRKRFFPVYEQRINSLLTHPVFDYKVSYRRALELQARILARVVAGEIEEYTPLTTR